MNILHTLSSGKNPKFIYFARNFSRYLIPKLFFQARLKKQLRKIAERKDYNEIRERVNYYNKLDTTITLPDDAPILANHTYRKRKKQSVYFFDTYEYTRWFPNSRKWFHQPGDAILIPPYPTIIKSRPIAGENANSVLLNLNKIRHFIFLHDTIPFTDKMDKVIFRGKVGVKPGRREFLEKYFDHPMCDLGDVSKDAPEKWRTPKKTLYEHLEYKFIMALEGNDVASNLKWIMSSNSIAVMPRPTYETWFMEGKLIPDYHYIEIKSDYSDLEERLNYYIAHPEKAQSIINHAQEYITKFKNKKREKIISLLVLQKYFDYTR